MFTRKFFLRRIVFLPNLSVRARDEMLDGVFALFSPSTRDNFSPTSTPRTCINARAGSAVGARRSIAAAIFLGVPHNVGFFGLGKDPFVCGWTYVYGLAGAGPSLTEQVIGKYHISAFPPLNRCVLKMSSCLRRYIENRSDLSYISYLHPSYANSMTPCPVQLN